MSYEVLKQEINQTHQTCHDIVKWKLILVSSISAVSFGLTGEKVPRDFHLLLLLLPLVCAYSDLLYYQNLLRIFVLATFLRSQTSSNPVIQYEKFVSETRKAKIFNLELFSQVVSSLIFSLAAVAALYLEIRNPTFPETDLLWPLRIITAAWLMGMALIIATFLSFLWLGIGDSIKRNCGTEAPRYRYVCSYFLLIAVLAYVLPGYLKSFLPDASSCRSIDRLSSCKAHRPAHSSPS